MRLTQAFEYINNYSNTKIHFDESEALHSGLEYLGYSQDVLDMNIDPMATTLSVELLNAMMLSKETSLHKLNQDLNIYQFLIFLICGLSTDIVIAIKERSLKDLKLSDHWLEEFSIMVINHLEANPSSSPDKSPEEWDSILFKKLSENS